VSHVYVKSAGVPGREAVRTQFQPKTGTGVPAEPRLRLVSEADEGLRRLLKTGKGRGHGESFLPAHHLNRLHVGMGRVLISFCMLFAVVGHASGQPGDAACKSYEARCQGRGNSPLCVQLRQRCGGAAGAAASLPSSIGDAHGMTELDSPTEMPDCARGQELVMVPTCQCDASIEPGAARGDDGSCATCTRDGVRMECRDAR
jgi:hypothetical protein